MNFTRTSDPDTITPFKTKEEVEKYLRDMQDKFIQLKKKYPEERLVHELEDETFVCIIKTQKACQLKVDEIRGK
tara:strand:+ start:89 stop:310 length:222 start_codon:yes stop_codon:yes gene_type:complete